MKWNRQRIIIVALISLVLVILAQTTQANPSSQTHTLDTSTCRFKLDNDSRLFFDETSISLGDSDGLWSWIDSDEIRLRNLKTGSSICPNPWSVAITGPANMTVSTLFEANEFVATVSAESGVTSTISFNCGNYLRPVYVKVDDVESDFTYNDATRILTFSIVHSSSHTVSLLWSKAYTNLQLTLAILYSALPLLGLIGIALIGGGIILAIKAIHQKETFVD